MSLNKIHPFVSIIIANYNGKTHLNDCFSSLFDINYPDEKYEVIMVDNGSEDDSVKYVSKEFPRIRIIRNSSNLGFSEASNIGAERAKGEFIVFLNNDMRVDKNWLEELVKYINLEDKIICVGSKILNWDGTKIDFIGGYINFLGHAWQLSFGKKDINDYKRRFILFACGGSMLVSKNVFMKVGGFDRDYFAFFEDVDLGWRLWIYGYKVLFNPKSVVYHRHHSTGKRISAWKKEVLYERNALFTIFKNYNNSNLNKILPAALLLNSNRLLLKSNINLNEYLIQNNIILDGYIKRKYKKSVLVLSKYGFIVFIKNIVKEIKRLLLKIIIDTFFNKYDFMPKIAISNLISLHDFTNKYSELLEKRRRIQINRRRKDKEIFKYFVKPFYSSNNISSYLILRNKLIKYFKIEKIFGK